ncbi:OmpA family protein [Erythrobacter sp.]|uniref:OmpA family protein n=1 Tax=Erythrobacter sp. TaxID=1042 RepID=UPI002ED4B1A5
MRERAITIVAVMLAVLSACDTNRDADDATAAGEEEAAGALGEEPSAEQGETVSILRPDIEQPELPEEPLSPLEVTIGFPDGGDDLDDTARAALDNVIASEQVASGGPIRLGAHSDTGGSDAVNMGVSEDRGLAVAGYLIERGVEEDRIDIVVFGEQNPAEPNALPDGSPNEEGRRANRRVEITVAPADDENGTAIEALEEDGL